MQHAEDQGLAFGTWPDNTSRLMYNDVMPFLLNGIDTSGRVADYGGANGLLKDYIPNSISVDYDATKGPDIVDDILTHRGVYNLIVMRYVLHYIGDMTLLNLMRHLATFHNGRVLVIQFVNKDLRAKQRNSVGERKWFRTDAQTRGLLTCGNWEELSRKKVDYRVEAAFYKNRLKHPDPTSHRESIIAVELGLK